ncbi:MAG: NAD(P)-dependent oxidoreductase [Hyphomicrobiaceae bacterium]
MAKVAWIGLGVMGAPMAGHILTKGQHDVVVWNRTSAKSEAWVSKYGGGRVATSPNDAAADADFVFSCVGNDDDLRVVTTGPNGAFSAVKPGACFIDNSTTSANVARELDAIAREHNFDFFDAPVSGGQAGAENGVLTVMVGGDENAFERARPVLDCYAKTVKFMGPAGSGQTTKMVNQICIAGLLQGLSEGLNFAECAGLDVASVIEAISKGAAQSWQMENRWETMSTDTFDFGFAVDWMRKDLGICLQEAEQNGASLPVTALVDQFYGDVQRAGGGRMDTSSLITRLKTAKR